MKCKFWLPRVREVCGITCGGAATLVAALTVIWVVLIGRLLIAVVKLFCLPLVILASLIYPDERSFSLKERVVEDVRQWWQIMQPEW